MIYAGGKLICPGCHGCELALLDGGRVAVRDGQVWLWLREYPAGSEGLRALHGNRAVTCRLCGFQVTVARVREQL